MAFHNTSLYVVAGTDDSEVFNDFHRFSLDSFMWETLHPSAKYAPVFLAGAATYNDYFYIFFGWSEEEGSSSSEVYRASLLTDFEWETVDVSENLLGINSFGFSLVDTRFVTFGGHTGSSLTN